MRNAVSLSLNLANGHSFVHEDLPMFILMRVSLFGQFTFSVGLHSSFCLVTRQRRCYTRDRRDHCHLLFSVWIVNDPSVSPAITVLRSQSARTDDSRTARAHLWCEQPSWPLKFVWSCCLAWAVFGDRQASPADKLWHAGNTEMP